MPLAHSIEWFFNEGIYKAEWLQVGLTIFAAVVNVVTLVVLFQYTRDTHTMAVQTKRQVDAQEAKQLKQDNFRYYLSSDAFQTVQLELTRLMTNAAHHNGLPLTPIQPICPHNWPEIAEGFLDGDLASGGAAMQLGIQLRSLDSAIRSYNEADYENRSLRAHSLMVELKVATDLAAKLTYAYTARAESRMGSKA